ncbi:MAG: aminoacyl-tRNA hydrolase [Saprospiraceae bacterium]|nr:aminoacyl-tRNA hydrolase [Saprospiraceae bacterium]
MKYLIIGLGNIGAEYTGTRHNLGFEVIDKIAEQEGCTFKNEQLGAITQFKYRGRQVYLLKPSTYMNLSGKAVRFWVQKLKIADQHWLIITDEIQFELGKFKLLKKGSDGGHNGLKSVQELMGTQNYPRLRIGIGNDFYPGQQVDYVLSKWSEDQYEKVSMVILEAADLVRSFVAIGVDRTMNQFNKKKRKEGE